MRTNGKLVHWDASFSTKIRVFHVADPVRFAANRRDTFKYSCMRTIFIVTCNWIYDIGFATLLKNFEWKPVA